ncbi:MAG: redoxin domain-containing protein [Alphaproteobacteria bacterium]|nr:redoxin domain-containing protein [Alphaproteobacteria bacterium]
MTSVYEFAAKDLSGKEKPLSAYDGKVTVFVNVASKCGFTPQYEGLEALYRAYKDKGFEVLGFPCNQFANQEPGDAAEIANFCSTTYDVTFPMFAKIDVNGPDAHPAWTFLKKAKPGLAGTTNVKWNFTKFLVDRSGAPRRRYAPNEKPEVMRREIEKLLSA